MKSSRLTVKGQVTLPKEFRESLRLRAGAAVSFEAEADGIKVRPIRHTILDYGRTLRTARPPLSDQTIRRRIKKLRARQRARTQTHG